MWYTAPFSPVLVEDVVEAGVVVGVALPPTTTAETLVVTETVGTGAAAAAGAGAGVAAAPGAGWPLTATASSDPSGWARSERISSYGESSSTNARPVGSMRSTWPGDSVPASSVPSPATASERTWAASLA